MKSTMNVLLLAVLGCAAGWPQSTAAERVHVGSTSMTGATWTFAAEWPENRRWFLSHAASRYTPNNMGSVGLQCEAKHPLVISVSAPDLNEDSLPTGSRLVRYQFDNGPVVEARWTYSQRGAPKPDDAVSAPDAKQFLNGMLHSKKLVFSYRHGAVSGLTQGQREVMEFELDDLRAKLFDDREHGMSKTCGLE
jgi:hypothetical protein